MEAPSGPNHLPRGALSRRCVSKSWISSERHGDFALVVECDDKPISLKANADRSGLSINLRSSHKVDTFSFRAQRSIFRIVQEALANAHRHGSASRVSVELRWIGRRLHLLIIDNGRGGRASSGRLRDHAGVGLRGIRMRLNQLGGRVRISSMTPHGTRIHASVPLDETGISAGATRAGRCRK